MQSSVGLTLFRSLLTNYRKSFEEYFQDSTIYLFTTASRPALRLTQPLYQWVSGALSLGVRRLEREADHSPPSSAEVKNASSYDSTPPVRLQGVVLN